jgi:hypothetical protein
LLTAVPPTLAQPNPGEPIRLTIRPAAAPVPALKYQLLPEIQDVAPGNAALLYYRAFSPEWNGWLRKPGLYEKINEALHAPLAELPRKELDGVWKTEQLRELDLAARREYVDWEFTARLRKEGVNMLLPDMQGFRQLGNLLALRTRFEMAEGHFDQAVYSLQTGLALGRHVADAPMLIVAMLGAAIAEGQLGQVETLIQTPGAPNLYWALTDLPRPFIDSRRPLQGEKLVLYAEVPLLKDLETAPFGPWQQQELAEQLNRLVHLEQDHPSEGKLELAALALKVYPEAKRALIAQGRKPGEVEALPVLQVVALHVLHEYRRLQDDLYRWFALPYPLARPHLEAAERQIADAHAHLVGEPFIALLPAVSRAFVALHRLDRRIAALRCVEAIRIHAAAHGGSLPQRLEEITEVPVPIDPLLDQPFHYEASGDHATLSAPAPLGVANLILTYHLTMTR